MSVVKIRAALETALNSMTPALSTAWENMAFSPVAGTPYQRVWFLDDLTENPTLGDGFYRIHSYFQIDLLYPLGDGTAAINARGELIKSIFHRGATFTSGGITAKIENTPAIGAGYVEGDRYKKIVKIRYWADIYP